MRCLKEMMEIYFVSLLQGDVGLKQVNDRRWAMINKILQGDCLQVMKDISDKSIDLIVTDPPYGIDLTPQRQNSKFKGEKVLNDNKLDWLPDFAKECARVLKADSVGYIFCNWQNYDVFKQEFQKRFTIKNCIVWDKDWFGMGNNWRPNHEFIMVITNGKFKTKSNNLANIIKQRRVSPQKLVHSCEKPIPLLELIIEESSDIGAVVLDSFAGSGTTAIASLNTGRYFIGIEKDEQYHKIACERVANWHDEQGLFKVTS